MAGELSAEELAELSAGLRRQPPELSARYFYDDRGSDLFVQITELPEYYQTRTEVALLRSQASAILLATQPEEILELGGGSGEKAQLLIDPAIEEGLLRQVAFMDVSPWFLENIVAEGAQRWPGLPIATVCGSFLEDLEMLGGGQLQRLVLFLGGTIGNLESSTEAPAFLASLAAASRPGDHALVGVDLVKPAARIEAAYNDSAGVTAAFNLNMLAVLNERFDADFVLEDFEHLAFYDEDRARIEMHLRALRPTRARVGAVDLELSLDTGEALRTEISCKYSQESFAALCQRAGVEQVGWFTDPEQLFGLALVRLA